MDIGDLSCRLSYCQVRERIGASNDYHSHHFDEWHYVLSGRASFMIDGRALAVGPGDFFYTEPQERHMVATPREPLMQYVLWTEDCSPPLRALLRARFPVGAVRPLGQGPRALFRHLEGLLELGHPVAMAAASHAFLGFLLSVLVEDRTQRPTLPEPVQRMCAWIEEHLDRPLTMDELARVAGCDRSHASRLFKRHLGLPPSRWVIDRKMRRAVELLRGDADIAQIAAQVGYGDPFHFSRVFKRWSGHAPRDHRLLC